MFDKGHGIPEVEKPSPKGTALLEYVAGVLDGRERIDQAKLNLLLQAYPKLAGEGS